MISYRNALFFFSSRRRHTRLTCDWSSDVCSSDLRTLHLVGINGPNWTTDTAWVKPGLAITMLWGVGGMVVIYLAALRQVPKELYEAPALDGAGAWMRFRPVTGPMISGAPFFALIVPFIVIMIIT